MRDGTPASKLKVICEVEESGGNGGKLGLSFFTRMLSSKNDIKVRVIEQGGPENERARVCFGGLLAVREVGER